MYAPGFVKIPGDGLHSLVELTWNDPLKHVYISTRTLITPP